jgi:hypothetical protein
VIRCCPHCGAEFTGHDPLVPGAQPKPGDLTLCSGCHGVGVYELGPSGELLVRAPDAAEQADIDADPRLAAGRLALHRASDSKAAVPLWRWMTEEPATEEVPRDGA